MTPFFIFHAPIFDCPKPVGIDYQILAAKHPLAPVTPLLFGDPFFQRYHDAVFTNCGIRDVCLY
jgi:hypothetical protein